MTFWLKVFIGYEVIVLILGVFRWMAKSKKVGALLSAPQVERDKILKSFSSVIKVFKLLFWLSPFYLIVMPLIFYLYEPSEIFILMTIAILLMYVILIDGYLLRKKIITELESKMTTSNL